MSQIPDNFYVANRRKVTTAVRDLLVDATGKPCGINEAPVDSNGDAYGAPYMVLFPVKGGRYFGPPLATPEADAHFPFIVHSHGERYDSAEWMSERVNMAMVGRDEQGRFLFDLVLPDDTMTVMNRSIQESPGPLDRDGKMFYVVDTFTVSVTSS